MFFFFFGFQDSFLRSVYCQGIEIKSSDISLEAKRYRCGFSECFWRSEEWQSSC